MLKRMTRMILVIMILVCYMGTAAAEENEDQAVLLYRQYVSYISAGELSKVVSVVGSSYTENSLSLVAQYGLSRDLYKIYPEFEVLEDIDVGIAGNGRIDIRGTELYVNAEEIKEFDKVLICKRECIFWDLIEFVGLVKEEGISRIGNTATLLYSVTLKSGRKINAAETYGIVNTVTAKGYETIGTLYSIVLQTQLNDILTSKYIHIDKEAEMKEYLEAEDPSEKSVSGEENVILSTSYGEARIARIQAHIYTNEALSAELYYITNETDRQKQFDQLKEISETIEENVPGITLCFPSVLYVGMNEEMTKVCAFGTVENGSYDEDLLLDP